MKAPKSVLLETVVGSSGRSLNLLKHPRLVELLYKFVLRPLILDHEPEWAKGMRSSVLKMGAGYVNRIGIEAVRYGLVATTEGSSKALEAFNEDRPVAWVDWMIPSDIVRAFGYEVWCPSAPFALSASQGSAGGAKYTAVAENEGVSEDLCSVNKSSLGAFFAGEQPRPSVMINGSHPCDSARMQNTILDYYHPDVPVFTMDTPYGRTETELKRWVRSAWDLIEFLRKVTGHDIDWDLLRTFGRNIDRFNRAVNEVCDLQRHDPAPPMPFILAPLWRWRLDQAGSENLALAAEKALEAARWYVENYDRRRARPDRIRVLIGDQNVVWTDFGAWLFKKFRAKVVMDYISRACYPPVDASTDESLVRTLAVEKLYLGMIRQSHGTAALNTDELASQIEEYRADVVIFNNNAGCKHNQAIKKLVGDICRSAGVPHLFLDLDIVDSRYIGEKELKEKITEFFKTQGLSR